MKIKYIILTFYLFCLFNVSYGNELIYNSNFIKVNIENELINYAKEREIESVKKISLDKIFQNILKKDDFNKINNKDYIDKNINEFIKNIIIEDEFITSNSYAANIKVNFDSKEVINFLRKNKINYSDFESKGFLIISSQINKLSYEGISKNNSFYSKFLIKKFRLLNFKIPDLSPNDRFILPKEKIVKLDLLAFEKISKKYKLESILIIHNENNNNFFNSKVFFMMIKKNQFL